MSLYAWGWVAMSRVLYVRVDDALYDELKRIKERDNWINMSDLARYLLKLGLERYKELHGQDKP